MSFQILFDRFVRDAAAFGPRALDGHVEALGELIEVGKDPSRDEGEALLKQLRDHRCFSTMLDVADLLGDDLSAMGRIYQAQALIDRNRLATVSSKLERIQRDLEAGKLDGDFPVNPAERVKAQRKLRSEALGLLGRLYKQKFVSAHARGDSDAADHLRQSMVYHEKGYPLDKAWHGSNLAALAWRAGKEGIALGNLPTAAVIGKRLEDTQRALGPVDSLDPWDISALAQARMAQEDWDEGLTLYRQYIRGLEAFVGDGAAFMLMGDLRQLQEVWLIDQIGEGPRAPILRELARRILANPDGSVTLTLDAVEHIHAAPPVDDGYRKEAIHDDERTLYLATVVENLVRQLDAVCRVRGRQGSGREDQGGSGFVVNGAAVGLQDNGPVLVTNAHVLAKDERFESSTVLEAEAEVFFESWKGTGERTFAISELRWESPPGAYDVSVWLLNGLPERPVLAPVCRKANPYPVPTADPRQRFGTVVPIGHPGGRSLTITLGSNPILDHDLHRDQGTPRVVHYKADTEPGSSGCPVFDRSGDVVAIHRASTKHSIAGSPKSHSESYAANEGVGIHSAARACRENRRE